MGLFGKIKNIFYDEEIVEIEEPTQETKREEKPRIEEVHIPKREAPKPASYEEVSKPVTPIYTERELFKSDSTFKFPIIDEEEEEVEPIRTRTRPNILDMERSIKREVKEREVEKKYTERTRSNDRSFSDKSSSTNNSSSEKTFRPSPVISPVYGVLDKNYKKEEIIERQHKNSSIRHTPADMNYDSVRRKAYGTLEDELENTLSKINSRTEEVMQTIEEVENLDTLSNSKSIEDLLNEIEGNHDFKDISIGDLEEKIKDKMEEEEATATYVKNIEEVYEKQFNKPQEVEEEVPVNNEINKSEEEEGGFDKTLEHDLFNLIDSMYEEREGE